MFNLHHNYAGRDGPPRAWPSAADRAAAGLAGSHWPGLWPARPPAASCGRRMRRGLRSQPRLVLTGTPSARQACLPGEEGGWGHSHRNSIADISQHSRATGRAPEQHCGSGARVAERFTRSGAHCAWSDTRCTLTTLKVLLWSTDPLVHDVSGDNQQVALRNLSSQHTASAVDRKISTKTKHQNFRTFN
jgi:hypothetical protein